jgi:hypothetical protein
MLPSRIYIILSEEFHFLFVLVQASWKEITFIFVYLKVQNSSLVVIFLQHAKGTIHCLLASMVPFEKPQASFIGILLE